MKKRPSLSAAVPVGFHVSIEGGYFRAIERALGLGCTALQIFSRNPRSWAFQGAHPDAFALFREKRLGSDVRVVAVHTSYLINLCSPDDELFEKSLKFFMEHINDAKSLGADFLVTHLGSSRTLGDEFAIKRLSEAFYEIAQFKGAKEVEILLENTAGGGYSFGSSLFSLAEAIRLAAKAGLRAGLCFDTCHAFAAGYAMQTPLDARTLAAKFKEAKLGAPRLIHLNDSKGGLGSSLDRHEHVGNGAIGAGGIANFFNEPLFAKAPVIMETPKKNEGDDIKNLEAYRRIRRIEQSCTTL